MVVFTVNGEQVELRSGDVLMCSGTGKLSKFIIWSNKLLGVKHPSNVLSHAAKYIIGKVFEATTLNAWCGKKGYQANPFKEWLDNYSGKVWVRQLIDVPINEQAMYQDAAGMVGTPYESGIPGMLELALTSAAIKVPWLDKLAMKYLRTKNLHCTEANVVLDKKGGYFDPTARPNKFPPYTFWTGGTYEKGFTKGRLGPPKQLK